MTNGRANPTGKRATKKGGAVRVVGPWLPLPLDFFRSRACAQMSPHASKLLNDLIAQLGPNCRNNGDLCAAPAFMVPRGWASKATLDAALRELQDADLLMITRRGDRKRPTLYAITLWHMDCDFNKLDHGPGSYNVDDWKRGQQALDEVPTGENPAKWKQVRKREMSAPATREPKANMTPLRGNRQRSEAAYAPAAGSKDGVSAIEVPPPGDTYLDMPSGVARVATAQAGSSALRLVSTRHSTAMPATTPVTAQSMEPIRRDNADPFVVPPSCANAKAKS